MPFRRKHNARNMEVVEPNIGSPRLMNVKLNVGGHYFTTSLQTLTKDPKLNAGRHVLREI